MREPRDPLLKVVLYCVKRDIHSMRLCVCKDVEPQWEDRVPHTTELQRVHRCEWVCKQSVHMPTFEDQQQLVLTVQ